MFSKFHSIISAHSKVI